ncbi:uncharacterized protein LOC127813705 [Diospyros lotus]|uniref:uncharacterized protein LOC127813705 n=1 Tax=Diospyros lotus TaxID=55363 RepID=UPI0022508328|nr:uncharacterized protein LOC127813705 [Diospyros lotus]XP_052210783.1 uncharacterized protein LOC127813705 [Diospyros lotus]
MRLAMELEFDKYCRVSGSPNTVLPSPQHHSKVEKRSVRGKAACKNDVLGLEKNLTEITFCRYRSVSCKNIPSRSSGLERCEVPNRGSVYQSSRELRKVNKSGAIESRRKIELSGSDATGFSLGIIDSLCSSDEDSLPMERKKSSVKWPIDSDSSKTSVTMANLKPCSGEFLGLQFHHGMDNGALSDGLSEIPLSPSSGEHHGAESVAREQIKDPDFRCETILDPINDGNGLLERENAVALPKSLSVKLALPHSPSCPESDSSKPTSPKARFSPIRRMLDPFTKSKSHRNPLGSASGSGGFLPVRLTEIKRNNVLRKSLLNDFTNMSGKPEFGSEFQKKVLCSSSVSCSPAHLHGSLKLEQKHGLPSFEFSMKFPEDVFVAHAWKADDALNWVYTFHSFYNRRKSNASGWGMKDWKKESSMVGQMQVSCCLCTELKDAGAFDNSMLTEFVLYDVAHARQSFSSQGSPDQSPDIAKPSKVSNQSSVGRSCGLDDVPNQLKPKPQPRHITNNGQFDSSTLHPWASTNLHPSLEIAAIVIQVPFENRESLKCKSGDAKCGQPLPNLLELSVAEHRKEGIPYCSSPTKVNVVVPSGNHGLPSTNSRGPSPLLDRWRLGGGCDCGGWDMACPLNVFHNPHLRSPQDCSLVENQQPLELFIQGGKDDMAVLTMTPVEEGRYSVDFHAQLTALQAFSICVAVLHCAEASVGVGWERDKQLLQCDSLRVLIGEEVKSLIEAVTEEEKRKLSKKMEERPASFKLNPPFSPIGRV